MVPGSRVVEGRFFELFDELAVTVDCLGRTYETVIGDQRIVILMPSLPDPLDGEDPHRPLVAPQAHYENFAPPNDASQRAWGAVTGTDKGEPTRVEVARLAYRFEITGTDDDVAKACRQIEDDLTTWWERVAMWLDTYAELDLLNHRGSRVIPVGYRLDAVTRHDDGAVHPVRWQPAGVTITIPKDPVFPDSVALERSFKLAGTKAALPEEWQYLREARSWLNAGQTRRAVIDACTAAEIALAHQVHDMLSGTDKVVIQQLLDLCHGVADVAQVVRKIGGTTASRNQVEQKLANVRNRAAHAGAEPQREETTQAVMVAADIVEHARPRESLHQSTP
ncbi:hypothetical protein [Nocardia gipuzkoensis]|uniref:hypothetical protein n=1 Tax=Nocardia gipuzkoensis TaxID=2749991 RepID=UPI00237D5409|nr:hypothetical protein [Nocardia gipuzkoensis]MDE1675280.1 hypothetical protein [Nocardia gipuzkoensis]